jgi:hypothetical protein
MTDYKIEVAGDQKTKKDVDKVFQYSFNCEIYFNGRKSQLERPGAPGVRVERGQHYHNAQSSQSE